MKAIHLTHQMLGSSCVPNVDKPQRPPLGFHGHDLSGGESGSPEQAAKFNHSVVMNPDVEWDAQIEIGDPNVSLVKLARGLNLNLSGRRCERTLIRPARTPENPLHSFDRSKTTPKNL